MRKARSSRSLIEKKRYPLTGRLDLEIYKRGSSVCVNVVPASAFGFLPLVSMEIDRYGRIIMLHCSDMRHVNLVGSSREIVNVDSA